MANDIEGVLPNKEDFEAAASVAAEFRFELDRQRAQGKNPELVARLALLELLHETFGLPQELFG